MYVLSYFGNGVISKLEYGTLVQLVLYCDIVELFVDQLTQI